MKPRITGIPALFPEALKAMMALGASVRDAGLSEKIVNLVHLRASQINGCSVCVDGHARIMKKSDEPDERIHAVAAWRDAPYFSDAERAALALAESVTRLSDRPDPVPDEVWNDAARHFDERELGALVVQIALINAFNRLNVATRQPAGVWKP